MDPLAAYLLEKWKSARTIEDRGGYESALEELGYWLMPRPVGISEERMCELTNDNPTEFSDFVMEFEWDDFPLENEEDNVRQTVAIYKERA